MKNNIFGRFLEYKPQNFHILVHCTGLCMSMYYIDGQVCLAQILFHLFRVEVLVMTCSPQSNLLRSLTLMLFETGPLKLNCYMVVFTYLNNTTCWISCQWDKYKQLICKQTKSIKIRDHHWKYPKKERSGCFVRYFFVVYFPNLSTFESSKKSTAPYFVVPFSWQSPLWPRVSVSYLFCWQLSFLF